MSQGMVSLGYNMSQFCTDAYNIVNSPAYSPNNPIKQAAIVNNLACKAFVGGVSQSRYGTITAPERILAILPPPVAPRTEEEMKTWNPEMLDAANAAAYEKWKQEAIAMIEKDEASGDYTPSGSLLDWIIENKWLVAAGVVGVLVLSRPRY